MSAADYPNLEDWEGEVEFELSRAELKHLIDSTHFSMAQQDVRYYLNGMSLETEEHIIRTVATDGHRLALVQDGVIKLLHCLADKSLSLEKGYWKYLALIEADDKLLRCR